MEGEGLENNWQKKTPLNSLAYKIHFYTTLPDVFDIGYIHLLWLMD